MLDIDTGQIVIEDTILAACELWLGVSVNQSEIVKMLTEAFKPDEAKAALDKLKADGLIENVQRHNKGDKYFDDLVKITGALSNDDKVPKIVVASTDIFRIPKPTLDSLDNVAAGARMDVMEKKMVDMDKNVTELLKNFKDMITSQRVPAAVLTPAAAMDSQGSGGGGGGRGYAQAAASGQGRQPRARLGSKCSFEEMDTSADNTDNANNDGNKPNGK